MEAAGLEVLIVSDPSNMHWLTGYDGWSFYVHQAVIVTGEGPPLWWGRGMDAAGATRTVGMEDAAVHGYPDHFVQSTERHPMDHLAGLLRDRGLGRGPIGVEMDNYWFTAAAFGALQAGLPEARFGDATGLVNWQRAVKSEAELALIRQAGALVSRMHARVARTVRPGLRKCDLVAEVYGAGLRYDAGLGHGGDYPAIVPMMPSGADAAAPHLTWDDRPLQAGEGTFFELAGVSRRYHCPLSRTIFLGRPPQAFRDAETAVLEGMETGLDAARAGATCDDVARAFFGTLKRHGFEKDSRAGYSIGCSYPPDWGERTFSIRQGDRTVLQENMTLHFMTGLWMEDWGFEITESLRITDGAPECLADVPRRLLVID